jgi:hypothetical protein
MFSSPNIFVVSKFAKKFATFTIKIIVINDINTMTLLHLHQDNNIQSWIQATNFSSQRWKHKQNTFALTMYWQFQNT